MEDDSLESAKKFINRTRRYGMDQKEFKRLIQIENSNERNQQFFGINRNWYDIFIISKDNYLLHIFNVCLAILTVISSFSNLHVAAFQ